jgi:hypothetical protein
VADRPIEVSYVRYKPGTSCLLGLVVPTEDGGSHLGYLKVFLGGGSEVCWEKYRDRTRGDGWVEHLPELEAVYFHFPLDREVLGLPFLADLARLKRILYDRVEGLEPGEVRVRDRKSRLTLIKYKPERRCIVRADLSLAHERTGGRSERTVVAQAYADDTGKRVRGLMELLRKRAADASFRIARPLGVDPERRILLREWEPGETMGDLLGSDRAEEAAAAAGRALRDVHSVPAPADLPAERWPEARDAALGVLADLRGVSDAELSDRIDEIEDALRAAETEAAPERAVLLHGDFYYHQVVLGPAGTVLIDWDEARGGDPVSDAGNFLAHLHLLELQGRVSAEETAGLAREFLSAYGGGADVPGALTGFTAAHLLRLAMVPFRNLRDTWREETGPLLDRARVLLLERTGAVP